MSMLRRIPRFLQKRAVSAGILALALLLAAGTAFRAGITAWENYRLRSGFAANEEWPDYRQGLPLSEIDFERYERAFFSGAVAPIGYSTVFTADAPIRYYREVTDAALAYEIPAGAALDWEPGGFACLGYGFVSLPSYERGWRWARPFLSAGSDRVPEDFPWYYVRTSDLEGTARAMFDSSRFVQASARNAGLSRAEAVFRIVRQADQVFYENGVYLSPDLLRPVWTWDCTLMTGASALLFILLLLLRRGRRRT